MRCDRRDPAGGRASWRACAAALFTLLTATVAHGEAVSIDLNAASVEFGTIRARQPALELSLGESGAALVRLPMSGVSAAEVPLLAVRLDTRGAPVLISLFAAFEGDVARRTLAQVRTSSAELVAYLGGLDSWDGVVTEVLLGIEGERGASLSLARVALQPLSVRGMLGNLRWGWGLSSDWSLSSNNVARPLPADLVLVSPLGFAYAFAALGAVLGVAVAWRCGFHRALGAGAALFLAGWLVADAHWLMQLRQSAGEAIDTFARRPDGVRVLAGPDAGFELLARRVNRHLASEPEGRLLVASQSDFRGMRAAYYLYPYNVYWRRHHELPGPGALRSGDFLLLLSPTQLRVKDGRLVYPDGALRGPRVDTLLDDGDVALLRVQS